jgi:hypothetical protein
MTKYYEIIRKLNVSNANELWVRPFVNAYYYKKENGVGLYKNVVKSTVYENADEVETRDLDVETGLVTLRPETKPVVCTAFKLSFVFGHFHVRESRKKEEIEEIEVTVLKPEEVTSVQELERQNRKPTWAKKTVL